MKVSINIPAKLVAIVTLAYSVLFIYAAIQKLIEVEQFRIQLGQSPILTTYADYIMYALPLGELVLGFTIFSHKFKRQVLYVSYSLMVMFTTYIILILNFSDYIPCSCGGVLEKLGWTEHIVFNLVFIIIAIIGLWCLDYMDTNKQSIIL
ncbi:MauE/DoxX family redox-associated membrane protein [Formosa sp. A9]|uniref:MauE/DoxX family redox-associated membrane protein n=1 Tax=Formosa sp. A9 TaxID=3442641 RepID=UPI003EBB110B